MRHPLPPIPRSDCTRYKLMRSETAMPTAVKSLWSHMPRILTWSPLTKRPPACVNVRSLMPIVVLRTSVPPAPVVNVVTTVYSVGVLTDHNFGLSTVMFGRTTVTVAPAAISDNSALEWPTTISLGLTTTTVTTPRLLPWMVATAGVSPPLVTRTLGATTAVVYGFAVNVGAKMLSSARCTDGALTSHTCLYSPAPTYQCSVPYEPSM
mmetsp:Transcript_13389/g.40176  ORF Transcript_13389/g.40176 Transcript_13389/m.40176 type:complete len:208 (-) Transcript_13389:825-1448(-)